MTSPVLRAMFRAPVHLYDWHAGWLLGHRFLRIDHVGRRSGRAYSTVVEVVHRSPTISEYVVVAGYGRRADWYRNVRARSTCTVRVGRAVFTATWRDVPVREATEILAAYERRMSIAGPLLRRMLGSLVGWRYDGSDAARARLAGELPMIALRPERPLR